MIPIVYPYINGHQYSFTSIEFGANGQIMRGIKSIDYGDKLTPGKMRGTGPNVIGRTRGEYDADASVEMYRIEWEAFKLTLGVAGVGFGEVAFPIVIGRGGELGSPVVLPVVVDTLEGCRVTEVRYSGQEGSDAETVKLTIDLTRILHNGVPMYMPTIGG